MTATPRVEPMLVEEVLRTGDSTRTEAGLRPGLRRTGKVRSVRVPVYDRFDPVLLQTLPYAYAIAEEQAPVIAHLIRHGVFVEQLAEPARVPVERFTIDSVARAAQPFQGHQEVALGGRWGMDSASLAAGTYIVRGGQPMGILALYLLEPQSDDGLVTWNVMDPWIRTGDRYPIVRVTGRIGAALRPVR
jgi:hypothetical protein